MCHTCLFFVNNLWKKILSNVYSPILDFLIRKLKLKVPSSKQLDPKFLEIKKEMFKIRKKKSHKHRCQKEKDASTVRNIPYVGQWTKFLGSVVFSCSYHLTCSSLSIFQTSLFDVYHDRYNFKYIVILLSQLLLFLLFSVLQVGTYNTQNHIYRFEISIFRK